MPIANEETESDPMTKPSKKQVARGGSPLMDDEDAFRAEAAKNASDGSPLSVAEEFYRRNDLAGDCETALSGLMDECGLNRAIAVSVYSYVSENHGQFGGSRRGADFITARKEFATVRDLMSRGFLLLETYVKNNGDRDMAWRCLMTMLGFPEVSGAENVAGLVKLLGGHCTKPSHWRALKSRVNKCLQHFQAKIPELPILPGQRTEEAKQNMSIATANGWRRQQRDVASNDGTHAPRI